MKILHTGDVHLEQPFGFAGDAEAELQRQIRRTFHNVLELAQTGAYDALLIAGDLFDRNDVKRTTLQWVAKELSDVSDVEVLILPGTHDRYQPGWVYDRTELQSLPPNIHVLRPGTDCITVKRLSLAVHGFPGPIEKVGYAALRDLRPCVEPGIDVNVAMVHGALLLQERFAGDDVVVHLDDIASSGMDYVALGHWHKFGDYAQKGVPACYSGSPETLGFDSADASGKVVSVEFGGNGKTTVRPIDIGRYRWCSSTVDISMHPCADDLIEEIHRRTDGYQVVRIDLVGEPDGDEQDVDALTAECSDGKAFLSIIDKTERKRFTSLDGAGLQPGTLAMNFLDLAKQMTPESDSDRAIIDDAVRIGLGLLTRHGGA